MTQSQWIEQAARILASIEYGDGHDEPFEPFLAQARALYPLVQQAVAAEREALNGYRAAVAFISADSWDGCSDCMEILHAARNADLHHDLTDPNDVAENLRRIRLHSGAAIRQMKDTAPE